MISASIKRILVTTDLSSDAIKAYPYAVAMAYQFGAELTLLSCIDTSVGYSPSGVGSLEAPSLYVAEAIEELRKTVANDLQKHILDHFAELATKQEIREAPYEVQNTILSFIQDNPCDLVIMASHGRSGISRALLGSVTEYVLRHCKTPVLVIPTNVAG
jgi:nucleotide-binding universal stress UspA family protein